MLIYVDKKSLQVVSVSYILSRPILTLCLFSIYHSNSMRLEERM